MVDEKKVLSAIRNFRVFPHGETSRYLLQYAKLNSDFSNYKSEKVVYIFAGPSGSGKRTFMANLYVNGAFGKVNGTFIPFVNRHYSKLNDSTVKLDTVQDEINYKRELLDAGKSFVMESAQFDESYFNFIKEIKNKYHYKINMVYVTKKNYRENELCGEIRKHQGGHPLDSRDKSDLEKMYIMDGINLRRAISICDSVFVIDNRNQIAPSVEQSTPVILMQKNHKSGLVEINPERDSQKDYFCIIRPKVKRALQVKKSTYKIKRYVIPKKYSQNQNNGLRISVGKARIPEGYELLETGNLINRTTGDIILVSPKYKPKK